MFTFAPSRASQPYRQGGTRPQGPALAAMLGGRTLFGQNPMDAQREIERRQRLSQLLAARLGS